MPHSKLSSSRSISGAVQSLPEKKTEDPELHNQTYSGRGNPDNPFHSYVSSTSSCLPHSHRDHGDCADQNPWPWGQIGCQQHNLSFSSSHGSVFLNYGWRPCPKKTLFLVPIFACTFELTLTKSCNKEYLKFHSNCMSSSSRMSWSEPRGQYSVSRHQWGLSTHAPINRTKWSWCVSFICKVRGCVSSPLNVPLWDLLSWVLSVNYDWYWS